TDFELPIGLKTGRIEDRGADGRRPVARAGGLHMGAAWPVASGAVDALWQFGRNAERSAGGLPRLNLWIGVVAEQALGVDLAPKVEVVRAIVTGRHRPESAARGVPRDRRLQ